MPNSESQATSLHDRSFNPMREHPPEINILAVQQRRLRVSAQLGIPVHLLAGQRHLQVGHRAKLASLQANRTSAFRPRALAQPTQDSVAFFDAGILMASAPATMETLLQEAHANYGGSTNDPLTTSADAFDKASLRITTPPEDSAADPLAPSSPRPVHPPRRPHTPPEDPLPEAPDCEGAPKADGDVRTPAVAGSLAQEEEDWLQLLSVALQYWEQAAQFESTPEFSPEEAKATRAMQDLRGELAAAANRIDVVRLAESLASARPAAAAAVAASGNSSSISAETVAIAASRQKRTLFGPFMAIPKANQRQQWAGRPGEPPGPHPDFLVARAALLLSTHVKLSSPVPGLSRLQGRSPGQGQQGVTGSRKTQGSKQQQQQQQRSSSETAGGEGSGSGKEVEADMQWHMHSAATLADGLLTHAGMPPLLYPELQLLALVIGGMQATAMPMSTLVNGVAGVLAEHTSLERLCRVTRCMSAGCAPLLMVKDERIEQLQAQYMHQLPRNHCKALCRAVSNAPQRSNGKASLQELYSEALMRQRVIKESDAFVYEHFYSALPQAAFGEGAAPGSVVRSEDPNGTTRLGVPRALLAALAAEEEGATEGGAGALMQRHAALVAVGPAAMHLALTRVAALSTIRCGVACGLWSGGPAGSAGVHPQPGSGRAGSSGGGPIVLTLMSSSKLASQHVVKPDESSKSDVQKLLDLLKNMLLDTDPEDGVVAMNFTAAGEGVTSALRRALAEAPKLTASSIRTQPIAELREQLVKHLDTWKAAVVTCSSVNVQGAVATMLGALNVEFIRKRRGITVIPVPLGHFEAGDYQKQKASEQDRKGWPVRNCRSQERMALNIVTSRLLSADHAASGEERAGSEQEAGAGAGGSGSPTGRNNGGGWDSDGQLRSLHAYLEGLVAKGTPVQLLVAECAFGQPVVLLPLKTPTSGMKWLFWQKAM